MDSISPFFLINLSISRGVALKNHDFKVSYNLAMAIVNSPVGIRKHYHSNIAASIKAIAKNVNLLDAWDYEEKNWQVNSCFLPQIWVKKLHFTSILSSKIPLHFNMESPLAPLEFKTALINSKQMNWKYLESRIWPPLLSGCQNRWSTSDSPGERTGRAPPLLRAAAPSTLRPSWGTSGTRSHAILEISSGR